MGRIQTVTIQVTPIMRWSFLIFALASLSVNGESEIPFIATDEFEIFFEEQRVAVYANGKSQSCQTEKLAIYSVKNSVAIHIEKATHSQDKSTVISVRLEPFYYPFLHIFKGHGECLELKKMEALLTNATPYHEDIFLDLMGCHVDNPQQCQASIVSIVNDAEKFFHALETTSELSQESKNFITTLLISSLKDHGLNDEIKEITPEIKSQIKIMEAILALYSTVSPDDLPEKETWEAMLTTKIPVKNLQETLQTLQDYNFNLIKSGHQRIVQYCLEALEQKSLMGISEEEQKKLNDWKVRLAQVQHYLKLFKLCREMYDSFAESLPLTQCNAQREIHSRQNMLDRLINWKKPQEGSNWLNKANALKKTFAEGLKKIQAAKTVTEVTEVMKPLESKIFELYADKRETHKK